MNSFSEDIDTIMIKVPSRECPCGKNVSCGPIKISISYLRNVTESHEEDCVEKEKVFVKKICCECNCSIYVEDSDDEGPSDEIEGTRFEQYHIKRCFLCKRPLDMENEDMCSDCNHRETKTNSPMVCSSKNCEISQYEAIRGILDTDCNNVKEDDDDHYFSTYSLESFEYSGKKYEIDDKNKSHSKMALEVTDEEDTEQNISTWEPFSESNDENKELMLKNLLLSGYLLCSCNNCEAGKWKNLNELYRNILYNESNSIELNIKCLNCKLKHYTDEELNYHVEKIVHILPHCECSTKPDKEEHSTYNILD